MGLFKMGLVITTTESWALTQVPNWFIRSYMPTANGNFIKLYLYLLMLCQHPDNTSGLSIDHLADALECTENDILRALRFWKKEHLLDYAEKDGNIVSIVLKQDPDQQEFSASSAVSQQLEERPAHTQQSAYSSPVVNELAASVEVPLPDKQTYTPLQAEALIKDVEIEQTISSVEQLLGTTISMTHLQLILYFMCDIGFSGELILKLYQTALKKGKHSPKYIEAIGISWAKKGIRTAEAAEEETAAFSGRYALVSRSLGIQRGLVPAEREIIDSWEKYHFSDTIIEEACKRTVLQTGGTNLQYVSRILHSWAKNNVISLSDIEQCDKAYKQHKKGNDKKTSTGARSKNQFQNFPQRTYTNEDYNSLEKQLLRSAHADS